MLSSDRNVVICDAGDRWNGFKSSKKARSAGTEPEEFRHTVYADPASGIIVGSTLSGSGRTRTQSHLRDELVTIRSGQTVIQLGDGGSISLEPGDTAFISAGTSYRWINTGEVVREFLWYIGIESVPAAFKVDPAAERGSSAGPSQDLLLTPEPRCESTTIYRRTDGRLTLLLWSATPYRRRAAEHRSNEYMRIISGDSKLVGGAGEVYHGSPGSGLFVPKGATVAWENPRDILKIVCFIS